MFPPARLYATDLSNAELTVLHPLLPPPPRRGRPPKWPLRLMLDSIFYVLRAGASMAIAPARIPTLAAGLRRLLALASRWHMGAPQRERAGPRAPEAGETRTADGEDHR